MTSSAECYVYIVLPGQSEFVTAGRFAFSSDRRGNTIGRFVYGRSYLARNDAVPIDPVELPLEEQTFESRQPNGLFSALRDAGPDYWGRRVIDRHIRATSLGELDYLLYSPDDRAGALGFGRGPTPPAPLRQFNRSLDLEKLQALADAIVTEQKLPGGADAEQTQELLLLGTSMGGARPKSVVEDEHGLWIAKFNRPDDAWNHARVERAMLVLGRACGLRTAESKLVSIGGRDVLLVKRFDREKLEHGYRRARMLSALTLLRAQESSQMRERWSYVLLAEELRRISSQPETDANELFRRMAFNALISNIDDHPRNHAVIAMNFDWNLSPAYDLEPSMPISLERRDLALECGDLGRYAHADNLRSQCARFLLNPSQAEQIVNEIEQIVRNRWREICRTEGVSDRDCDRIASAFAYPGFRFPLPK